MRPIDVQAVLILVLAHSTLLQASAPPVLSIQRFEGAKQLPQGAVARYGSSSFVHEESIQAVAIAPTGKEVATLCLLGQLTIWDLRSGRKIIQLTERPGCYRSILFTPDGNLVAGGFHARGGLVSVWSPGNWRLIWENKRFRDWIISLGYTPHSNLLVAGSSNGLLYTLCSKKGSIERRWVAHEVSHQPGTSVHRVAISNTGLIASAGVGDRKLKFWTTRGRSVAQYALDNDVLHLAFDRLGDQLAYVTENLHFVDCKTKTRQVNKIPGLRPSAIAYSPDGSRMVVEGVGRRLCILDSRTSKLLDTIPFPVAGRPGVQRVEWSTCGKLLVWTHPGSHSICVWDVDKRRYVVSPGVPDEQLDHLLFLPRKRMVLTAGGDGLLHGWDMMTGKLVYAVRADHVHVLAVALSPDQEVVATAGVDKMITLWSTSTGQELVQCRGHQRPIKSLAFSDNRTTLLSVAEDQTFRRWNCKTGEQLGNWVIPCPSSCDRLSPDGAHLASTNSMEYLELASVRYLTSLPRQTIVRGYRVPSGERFPQLLHASKMDYFYLPKTTVYQDKQAFSPDGKIFLFCDKDYQVHLIDTATKQTVEIVDCTRQVRGIQTVAMSKSRRLVAIGSNCGHIVIWNRLDRRIQVRWKAHPSEIRALTLSDDDQYCLSAGSDSTALLWNLAQVKRAFR